MVDSMKGLDEYVDMEVIRHRSLSSDRGFHCIQHNGMAGRIHLYVIL